MKPYDISFHTQVTYERGRNVETLTHRRNENDIISAKPSNRITGSSARQKNARRNWHTLKKKEDGLMQLISTTIVRITLACELLHHNAQSLSWFAAKSSSTKPSTVVTPSIPISAMSSSVQAPVLNAATSSQVGPLSGGKLL